MSEGGSKGLAPLIRSKLLKASSLTVRSWRKPETPKHPTRHFRLQTFVATRAFRTSSFDTSGFLQRNLRTAWAKAFSCKKERQLCERILQFWETRRGHLVLLNEGGFLLLVKLEKLLLRTRQIRWCRLVDTVETGLSKVEASVQTWHSQPEVASGVSRGATIHKVHTNLRYPSLGG